MRWQRQAGLAKDLWPGDKGVDVRLLQRALKTMSDIYPSGSVTGFFGTETTLALVQFQKKEDIPITGYLDHETRRRINDLYIGELCPVADRSMDDYLLGDVNTKGLPDGYVPPDLINISKRVTTIGIVCLREEAAASLEKMLSEAAHDGVRMIITSGFRNHDVQEKIKEYWVSANGRQQLEEVAAPGRSEHQLGTAVDLTGASNRYRPTDLRFALTDEGKWLVKNASRFGFVMSYPIGRQKITGYPYEPWHWRYIGIAPAEEINKKNITLNQYLNSLR